MVMFASQLAAGQEAKLDLIQACHMEEIRYNLAFCVLCNTYPGLVEDAGDLEPALSGLMTGEARVPMAAAGRKASPVLAAPLAAKHSKHAGVNSNAELADPAPSNNLRRLRLKRSAIEPGLSPCRKKQAQTRGPPKGSRPSQGSKSPAPSPASRHDESSLQGPATLDTDRRLSNRRPKRPANTWYLVAS